MTLNPLSNDPIAPRTLEQIQAEALKCHPLRRAEDEPTEIVAFAVAQHLRAVRARVQGQQAPLLPQYAYKANSQPSQNSLE